jgi:hypothetical protein
MERSMSESGKMGKNMDRELYAFLMGNSMSESGKREKNIDREL